MKKNPFACILLTILCVVALLFTGCEDAFSPEVSDLEGETTLQTEREGPPQGPLASEGDEGDEAPLTSTQEGSEEEKEQEEIALAEAPFRYAGPTSDLESYSAACAKTNVNVRCGAGTGYRVLRTLRAGDSLPYLWREGEWLAVWTGDRVGYLAAAYAFLTETNGAIEKTIRAGLDELGVPYEWGAPRILDDKGRVNPYFTGKSFDCSSFVQYCYYVGCGIKLGNYTGSQADHTVGKKIFSYGELKRGDFYFTGNGSISHVVIYLGNHLLLQAYSANGGPVSLTSDDRWKGKFLSGRRPDLTVTEQFR